MTPLAKAAGAVAEVPRLEYDSEDSTSTEAGTSTEEADEDENLLFGDIIKDTKFWHLYLMNFCSAFYGYILISQYKVFGSQYFKDDMYLTTVGSVACMCGSFRFVWSMLLDFKFTYTQVYGTLVTM